MTSLPVTELLASILALTILPLTMLVSFGRISLGKKDGDIAKYPFGDIENEQFRRRRSALQNFCEYTPLALIMLALMELKLGATSLVWGIGIAFTIGRIIHPIALLTIPQNPIPRALAMFATYAIFLIPAVVIIFY